MNYTRYDLAITHLAFLLNEKRKSRLQVLHRIDAEISTKRDALDQEIADFLDSNGLSENSPFTDRSEVLYVAYPIGRGEVSIAYTVFRPHKDGGAFIMDNAPNQLMIDSTGSIRHYVLANKPEIKDDLVSIQWQQIQAFD